MPILDRTPLNASDKLHFLAKAAACQAYGDISRVSSEFDVSRKTVHKAKNDGLEILNGALAPSGMGTRVDVDSQQLKRTIISLSMYGVNSIRAILNAIPIIYPSVNCCFGYIQNVQIQAQKNAEIFNKTVNLSAIDSGAIDEVFCQGKPVLAGIDLDSGFVFSLAHEAYRNGETWERVLNDAKSQGLDLKHIVKDGAKGMTKGVNDVFPMSEQRDDAFHALYVTTKSLNKVEKRAYRLIGEEYALANALKKASDDKKEKLEQRLAVITERCKKAVARYDYANKGYQYLHRALSSVHINEYTQLMSPQSAQTLLKLSARYLKKARHSDCDDAARYISNRLKGLTLATADFYQKQLKLCTHYPQDMVALACYFFEYKRSLKKVRKQKLQSVHKKMLAAYHHIYNTLREKTADTLMQQVEGFLGKRHRASSAIEGFNSLLRPYMYVRKGVSQGFLELFKAWHNLRIRHNSDKHKGTSAYEVLTGKPAGDWLTLLGFPPSNATH